MVCCTRPAWAIGPTLDRATALGETAASYERKVRQDLRDLDRYRIPLRAYRLEGWRILPRAVVRDLVGRLHRRGLRVLFYFRAFVANDVAGTEPSGIFEDALRRGVVARTGGTIGEVAALLRAAAAAAITGGEERVTAAVLARAAYRGPGERRDAVGRELA